MSRVALRKHWKSYAEIGAWVGWASFSVAVSPDDLVPLLFGAVAAVHTARCIRAIRGRVVTQQGEQVIADMLVAQITSVVSDRKFVGPGVEISNTRSIDVAGRQLQVIVREAA